jgi:pimeloyl-ACP methyl ester carboxylesterase
MAQHVSDVIGFIEKLNAGPVDLVGHSRGGHIGFRVAQHIPGARTAVIPGARHWIFDQAPQEYSDAVTVFLAA